jgi:hypothetical protein
MAITYEPIASTTLSSSSPTITFSSIAASWTDLRLVIVAKGTAASDVNMVFNSSGSACSWTQIAGSGSAASSGRITTAASRAYITLNFNVLSASTPYMYTADILSYTDSKNKTCLITFQEDNNGSGYTGNKVGMWPSTAAITSITLNGTDFATGTTATLYGITKA